MKFAALVRLCVRESHECHILRFLDWIAPHLGELWTSLQGHAYLTAYSQHSIYSSYDVEHQLPVKQGMLTQTEGRLCLSFANFIGVPLPARNNSRLHGHIAFLDFATKAVFAFPQIPACDPLAPNRAPVQVARVGRAVLNQKQNRSIGTTISAARGALTPARSFQPDTYPAPSRRGLQAV